MRRQFALSVATALLASAVNAAPTVSTIKPTSGSNPTIEITGSGFGGAPNVIVFDQFEAGTSAGSAIPVTAATQGAWSGIDGVPEYDSLAHSGKFSARTWAGSPRHMGQFQAKLPDGTTSVLMSYWVHIPPGTPFPGQYFSGSNIGNWSTDSSWKMAWVYDQSYSGGDADVCLPTHVGYGIFQINGNDGVRFGDAEGRVGIQPDWWNWNNWMRVTTWLRANASDPLLDGDWYFNVVSAGKTSYTMSGKKPIFDADGAAIKQYRNLHIPGWYREQSSQDMRPLYDDIYVAVGPNSAARIELGNASTLSKVTALEIQPVVSWADGKVTVKLNQGGIKDLNQAYLYITDQNNVTNATGIPLFNGPTSPVLTVQ